MKRIKYLPGSVHSSLRSSIFLFDLTRVMEELILNSLDAGATKIHVCVNVGACFLKVEDNGFGVTRDGLVLLGEKYATSKLRKLPDMDDDIESLNSRGEALSSLSDISLLEVITKARGRPNAYRKVMKVCIVLQPIFTFEEPFWIFLAIFLMQDFHMACKGRKCLFLGIDEHRQEVGTTVTVRDLFYNQPVRRRSMQSSPKKMLHSVKKCIVRAALVHPQVSFSVLDLESENQLLHTLSSSSPLPLLSNNFGSEISHRLHEVNYSDKELDLSGYLSGPADTCSVKAFQYFYVNSRFVCRGPVHKLINKLASSFCLSLNHQNGESEFHKGKRQRIQGCPAYMLNLHCPFCSYDLTFEASKTVVEFKDWPFVLSFIEKAVWHVWKQLPACPLLGESHKPTYDTSEGISGEEFFAPDASVSSEMSNKEFGSHAKKNVLFHSPYSFSKELPLKDHNIHSSHRGSSGRLNGKASGIKLCGHENNFGHQIDYFPKRKTFRNPDNFCFKHDEIISPIKLCRERKAFDVQDISGFSHSEIIYSKSKNRTHPWLSDRNISAGSHLLSDQIIKVDKHDHSLLVSDGERNLTSDSEWDRLKCNLNQDKTQAHTVPFLLRCSRGHDMLEREHFPTEIIQAGSAVYSDHKNLGPVFEERESFSPCDRYLVDTYYSGESSDAPDNNPSKEQLDHFQSPFGSIMSCLDKTASNKLPTNLMQFLNYHEPYSPEKTSILPRGDSHSIENTFTSQLGYSDEFPRFPNFFSSCSFMTNDWPDNVRSEGNYNSFVGLASRQCQTSELDMFEDNFQDGSREMVSIVDCKDDKLRISPVRMVHQNCSSHKNKFEKGVHAEINDRTAWLSSDFSNLKNRGGHSTQAVDLPVRDCRDETPCEVFQHCQFSHSSNLRPRRSSSAPPFYKHKSKYYTIYDYSKTIKAKDQQARNSDNGGTFAGSACTSKDLLGPFGTSPPFSKSVSDDPASELLDGTCVDKKASEIEINMVQINEGSEKGISDMEYSNINMTKWRSGDLCPTSVQVRARTHHFDGYEDGILDISSGVLHLAGGSFVPESISRDSLEDAKVLLQVDRKFILVVAGGILIAIDQHAADERIRLEDLRQKVMSGEGRSIHYFDVEQELLLPEIGVQLIQNYGEQIKRWGWICSSHVQCSGSFTRNLNLLKQQSCRIDLLAVPCILGINLTDRDLLEYLEQLADTDGASTLPPSVIRVLNFKACRGAIMFGDPLLPSECSLIVDELKKTALCFQCAHGRPTTAPLVNMVELHRHLAKLETSAESRSEVWHGLQQHIPSLERAQERLSSAERFHNG